MKLFTIKQVKKFFNILDRMESSYSIDIKKDIYKGYDKNNPHISYCQRQVFVKRTIHKWLKNKLLIYYAISEQSNCEYKQYISISNISLVMDWGKRSVSVRIFDYTKPADIWNEIIIDHNKALELEGEWCKNPKLHNQLLKFSVLDIPEKEYVFKTYNWDKYPKKRKKSQTDEDCLKLIEGKISFKAKTEKEAYKKKKQFEENKELLGKLIITSDIIKIN